MSSSFAPANHRAMPGVRASRRVMPFPPAPKSVRVLSVFSEGSPDASQAGNGTTGFGHALATSCAVWILGITLLSGFALVAVFWGKIWNQLSN